MTITVKKREELTHYESNGEIGEGEGLSACVTYRLQNGKMAYVPE